MTRHDVSSAPALSASTHQHSLIKSSQDDTLHMRMHVQNSARSDVGCCRVRNEDAFFANDTLKLYVVSDGMGGHKGGDVASRMVIKTLTDHIHKQGKRGGDTATRTDLSEEATILLEAIRKAHKSVRELSQKEVRLRGMGATVSAIWICGKRFVSANVGDSPVYRIHGGTIELVSVLHNLSGSNGVLTRAVGISDEVTPDLCECQCYPGDLFVVCSDGLSHRVSEEEIFTMTTCHSPEEATKQLIHLAKKRGGEDNITVVVVKVSGRNMGVTGCMARLFRTILAGVKKG